MKRAERMRPGVDSPVKITLPSMKWVSEAMNERRTANGIARTKARPILSYIALFFSFGRT